jgi:hypothetical protein
MKYVEAVWDDGGFFVDASAYLAESPRLRAGLPPGARSFATDPGHYDIPGATRCVKDLEPAGVHLATDKSGGLVLDFAANGFKHDSGLRISYTGVTHAGQCCRPRCRAPSGKHPGRALPLMTSASDRAERRRLVRGHCRFAHPLRHEG